MKHSPPYVIFPMTAALELAERISPQRDCDEVLAALAAIAEEIAAKPLDAPERQLLAALRWRARWFSVRSPTRPPEPRENDVHYWLTLQSGCPLNA